MDFKQSLIEFKKKIDQEIEIFFNAKIRQLAKEDEFVAEGMRYVQKLVLSGGKRIRPALVWWGYRIAGGKDEKKILHACVGVELIHIFFLIHDDIIDESDRRHGIATLNVWGEEKSRQMFQKDWARRFGDSMAIVLGDLTQAWAQEAVLESGLDSQSVLEALKYLQKVVATTCVGEAQDVLIEYREKVSEEEILRMCENKTARYTFVGPLCFGALLAGAEKDLLKKFESYGVPLGIAFQIQDDILGVFGSEEKLGKSTASDIMEGKKTILTTQVMAQNNLFFKERMQDLLGKKNISSEEINEFQKVIMDSGALKYARQKAEKYAQKAKRTVKKISNLEGQKFLENLADYIIRREV